MEAHGGYLCRMAEVDSEDLLRLAREALAKEAESPKDCSLLVSSLPRARVVRLAFDAPFTYGRKGARWYGRRHALARLLSSELNLTVHAYVFDPEELEQVVGYGAGRPVGGETVHYLDAELPDDEELDDLSFEKLKSRWPMGHLAKVLGVTREELVRIPRAKTVLLPLDGRPGESLEELFRPGQAQAALQVLPPGAERRGEA
ncbi:MAG: hypothetical protein HYZ28_10075 [Myxococcales bacterium]|nr:hypothetical protein [Myxococcales bacterium]